MWLSGVNLQVYTKNRFYWATYAYMYLNNFLLTHIMKSNTLQNDQNEETMLSSTLSHFSPVHVTFYTHFIRISLLSSLWPIKYVPAALSHPLALLFLNLDFDSRMPFAWYVTCWSSSGWLIYLMKFTSLKSLCPMILDWKLKLSMKL